MRALTIVLQAFDITVYDISWAGLAFLNIYEEKKKRYSYGQDYYYYFFFYMDILKNMRGCDLRPTLVLDGYIPIATLLQHIF